MAKCCPLHHCWQVVWPTTREGTRKTNQRAGKNIHVSSRDSPCGAVETVLERAKRRLSRGEARK